MKKILIGLFMIIIIAASPTYALAVDFEIDQTEIHAELQENGEVKVSESHTYSFEGEFNGITRSLIPKEGTSITNFHASENGNDLKVELEDEIYKIHRSGEDEEVTIQLFYTIKNGIDVYSDVADFYWPFFDESNESTYENLTIFVEPPAPAEVKAAYGEEEAYNTEEVQTGGLVVFAMGEVPDGRNGNIRVTYDSDLFSAAALTNDQDMLSAIQSDKAELDANMAAKAKQEERWGNWAPYIFSTFLIIALLLTIIGWRKRTETRREAQRQESGGMNFPKEKLSLPAMIAFMKGGYLTNEALTSALLDLYRKGYIEKISDQGFRVVSRNTEYSHEDHLMDWLFHQIGDGETFSTKDLEEYTKNKENHTAYQENFQKWQEEVKKEYKQLSLFERSTRTRWGALVLALVLLPFLIIFPIFGQLAWMFFSLLLFIYLIGFAIAYQPLTILGHRLKKDLKPLKKGDDWKTWEKEDQIPALLYQIGLGTRDLAASPGMNTNDWVIFLILAGTLNNSFDSANHHVSASTNSGGFSGSGTGVGGGGGGSGAF